MEGRNVPWSLLLALCSVSGSLAASHSLKYFYLHSIDLPHLPTFSRVGMLDDLQIDYYDSSLKEVEPRQPWMEDGLTAEYWNQQKEISDSIQKLIPEDLNTDAVILGIHYFQGIWGCSQSETTTDVFVKFNVGDVGEINCDIVTLKCSATGLLAAFNDLLSQMDVGFSAIQAVNASCIPDLQSVLELGKTALERKVAPGLVVSNRGPSPEEGETLVCLITPFYPRAINATWLKNGQAVSAGSKATVLPNYNGTYWMELRIELQGRDARTFSCQVQHSSLSETLTLRAGVGRPYEAFRADSILRLMVALAVMIGAA